MGEPITIEGMKALKKELAYLITAERPKILDAIAVARDHGDLKENAEYHAAREKQSFIEGRIQEINGIIAGADIIDLDKIPKDRIVFGSVIRLLDENSGKEVTYQIVGNSEADLKSGKIAYTTPIARAMIGKKPDDLVEVRAPKGLNEYTVLEIS